MGDGKTANEGKIGRDRPMRLGTRRSPLALAQTRMVAAALCDAHGWRRDQVELVEIVATGDKVQDRALAEIGGKALWTREIDRALLDGEIDAAVHSVKDIETQRPDALLLAAMLERADPSDRLIGAASLSDLPDGATIGTSSPRRRAQLLALRPDLKMALLRGNVQTRLDKIEKGEADATLLAAAGLDRLGMRDTGVAFDHADVLPAVAQGAVGIEARLDDTQTRRLLAAISHKSTFMAVMAERAFLAGLEADCHSPVAAHAIVEGGRIELTAELLAPDGSDKIRETESFTPGEVTMPGRMARQMFGKASEAVRAAFSA